MALTKDIWDHIFAAAEKYNVDPFLLAAIGQHETGWGDLGDGRKGMYMGYGSYDSGSDYGYAGLDKQLNGAASKMKAWGMTPGNVTLDRLKVGNSGKLPTGIYATDQSWPDAIWKYYQGYAKQGLPIYETLSSLPKHESYVEGGSLSSGGEKTLLEKFNDWRTRPILPGTIEDGQKLAKAKNGADQLSQMIGLGSFDDWVGAGYTAGSYLVIVVIGIFALYMMFKERGVAYVKK